MSIFLIKHDLLTLQFKIFCKGCWESLVYNKNKKNALFEIGSITLSANPWIRHFRSPCVMTKRNLESSDMIDNSQFTRPSPHTAIEGHYGEGTGIKQTVDMVLLLTMLVL